MKAKDVVRCKWVTENPLYIKYHDEEWGIPNHDDGIFFEFLVLESAQAGLNWLTVLKKREGYRKAYDNFDYYKVAEYDENKVQELLSNKDIIRNKLKINASVNNAKQFIHIIKEFGSFDTYIWQFTKGKVIKVDHKDNIPAHTALSDEISKDMKKRGFKFVGTTIIYAYLQAMGIVDDHETHCFKY